MDSGVQGDMEGGVKGEWRVDSGVKTGEGRVECVESELESGMER